MEMGQQREMDMRFVHVIARLKKDLEGVETKLDDLDDMAIEILHGDTPYVGSDKAMVALIEACEVVGHKEAQLLGWRIAGYEYRRDFRTS